MNKRKNMLSITIIVSLIFSIIIGACLQEKQDIAMFFSPLGTIYVNLIKMIMVPLVFTSLVLGISSISDVKKIGKMGIGTVIIFLFTTAMAVIIGLILSNVFKPGIGIKIDNAIYETKEFPSLMDSIIGIFPSNITNAFLNANMLQIIFIAIVIGIGIVKSMPKGTFLHECIEDIFVVMITITNGVMALTPIGILGLMVPTVAQNGLDVLLPLGKLILVFYLAVIIHICIVYCISLKFFSDLSVKNFFTGIFPVQVIAFVTCSSAAALPVSIQRMQEKLNISKEVSGFVLPLGATINMDGNALYQGIVALFIAQAYGIEMNLTMQLLIILTGTLASIGAAGVPGAGMIVLSTVLMSVGLPVDGIALIAGIDRILDMGRTMTNVTGDAMTACIIEKQINGNKKETA